MEQEIYIKSLFSGWRKATKEQAQRWAEHFINHAGNREKAIEIVRKRLKGITLEELFK